MYINTKALYSLLNYRLHLVGSLNIIFLNLLKMFWPILPMATICNGNIVCFWGVP
jgi:hypothetical protein